MLNMSHFQRYYKKQGVHFPSTLRFYRTYNSSHLITVCGPQTAVKSRLHLPCPQEWSMLNCKFLKLMTLVNNYPSETYWNSKAKDRWWIIHAVNNCIILNIVNFNMPKGDKNTMSYPVQESSKTRNQMVSQNLVHIRLILKTTKYNQLLLPAGWKFTEIVFDPIEQKRCLIKKNLKIK